MDVLEPIWTEKRETASRVRQRIEAVLDWCHARGYRPADNPAGRHLLKVLPKVRKVKEHHRALPYQNVSTALRRIRLSTAYPLTKLGFEFMVLTASRSGEVRGAQWNEFNWEQAMWSVPGGADEGKARTQGAALSAGDGDATGRLAAVRLWRVGVPCSERRGHVRYDLPGMLRRLEIPAVPHGFRSSFRDWAAEQSGAGWAVCESALAHTVGNSVEASYMRSDLLDQRRGLMQDWADFCVG